ncbi:GNAT family N-acetyltransferase [Vibrio lamellibrachiae]|uniref:GNAT family N-acetyltransferase n=1 Tax=Vibrio lamellibrachiae TaxID=2910253 RepID=UPI003D13DEF2
METERLILRQWHEEDFQHYAQLNADSRVMKYFPSTLSKQESDDQADRIRGLITERGWGFWAVELKSSGEFIGFVGLHSQDENSGIPNAPFVEIGWRLSSEHWGKGYAPEAARRALEYAFEMLNEASVYAFTTLTNEPSQRVMSKVGMTNVNSDFNHPKLPDGHELERHCLYRMTRAEWLELCK